MTDSEEQALRDRVTATPTNAAAWQALIDFTAQRDGGAALSLIGRALSFVPADPGVRLRQALLLANSNRLAEAEPILRALCDEQDPPAAALANLAVLLQVTERTTEAAALAFRGVALYPDDADLQTTAGKLAAQQGDQARALGHLLAAARLKPADGAKQHDAGTILWKTGELKESIPYFQRAVENDPAAVNSWIALSNALMHLDRREEAVAAARSGVALAPKLPETRKQLAYALFANGNLAEGWDAYRARLDATGDGRRLRHAGMPEWQGGPVDPTKIVFWMEQGLGDQIFFANMLPDVAREFPGAAVEADPRLIKALARSFPSLSFIPQTIPPQPEARPPHRTVHYPMADLGGRYRRRLDQFPAARGFLTADQQRADEIERQMPPRGQALRIGVVWTSSYLDDYRKHWFATPAELATIFQGLHAELYNLQYGWAAADMEIAARAGLEIKTLEGLDLFADIEGVFALMSRLDCVVGPGNTATQMAAALGLPVFRFYFGPGELDTLGQDFVPWLPSLRQFRRKWGEDWGPAFKNLRQALIAFAQESGKVLL